MMSTPGANAPQLDLEHILRTTPPERVHIARQLPTGPKIADELAAEADSLYLDLCAGRFDALADPEFGCLLDLVARLDRRSREVRSLAARTAPSRLSRLSLRRLLRKANW